MVAPEHFSKLAASIDAVRADRLARDLGVRPLAVLLGTAFPPLTPQAGWQIEALDALAAGGWRTERRTQELLRLLPSPAEQAPEELDARLARLHRVAWAEKARIALRELLPAELGGAEIETTSRELSRLADVLLERALGEAQAEIGARHGAPRHASGEASRLAVIGLGKLGGLELNAGSDVDLLFVYDTDEGESSLSLHEHWTAVVRRSVEIIGTPSPDGLLWRVDLRLRPEGSQGALVNSADAVERYYARWGRFWERAALLRARTAAGDTALGALLERDIFTPFVFRREVDPSVAENLADLVQRSRSELSPDPKRDLKLGRGGIREAEFFVQTLQLVWGGREPSLRVGGTLPALGRLRSRGLVSDGEARTIAEAYALLRRLEHRVQWISGVQTHLLPTGDELGHLARTVGTPEETLVAAVERARATVHALFTSLAPSRVQTTSPYEQVAAALSSDDSAALAILTDAAYGDGEIAEHLRGLARRPDDLLGELTRDRYPGLAIAVLDEIGSSPDPEQAARYLRSLLARFPSPEPYVAALAQDRVALRRLVTALAASAFIGDTVLVRPEVADTILFGAGAISDPSAAVEVEVAAQQQNLGADADPEERRDALVRGLRVAKQRLVTEVATADLAGTIGTRDATRLLAALADEELEHAVEHVVGPRGGLAVIAMGKLGGREIGYGSDLDVVFIYDPKHAPEPDEAGAWYSRAAGRVIRLISEPHLAGPGYDLDTRLRPSGSHGMLVTSLTAFARYHGVAVSDDAAPLSGSIGSSGAAWERQALIRARFAAGDATLGARAIGVAERAAYGGGAAPATEVHHLRTRMERELGRERRHRLDLKSGRGGLLDIEFAVQLLQMQNGADEAVRTSDTSVALEALAARGYLRSEDYAPLREGYGFLRRLEQRIHVLYGTGSSIIETRAPGLPALARRMGYRSQPGAPAEAELLAHYRDVTENVRAAYLRVFGLDGA